MNRLGYGAMQLTGAGVWGDPKDPEEALRVLRRALELGVNFIDTADAYGPFVSELLIKKALHPYDKSLIIATKAGLTRQGPNRWTPVGRPEYLRQQVELSLRHLGLERIDLLQLHRVDPKVPLAESLGELLSLQREGKIRHLGLSEVSVAQLDAALKIAPIVSVQNLFNLTNRSSEPLLDHATKLGVAFIPWFPLATGALAKPGGPLHALAEKHQRHSLSARPGLAAPPLTGHAAHPRHLQRQALGRERRRRRAFAQRHRARSDWARGLKPA